MPANFSGDHLESTQGSLSVPVSTLSSVHFQQIYCGPNYGPLAPLLFIRVVPFISLCAHSEFPPSLPLILLTALFAHPSQQPSKKQLWSIFSTATSAGDWWQQSQEKDLRQLGYKTYWVYKSVKCIKLLSGDRIGVLSSVLFVLMSHTGVSLDLSWLSLNRELSPNVENAIIEAWRWRKVSRIQTANRRR